MKDQAYEDLTYAEAEIINYDFFSQDAIDRHVSLVEQHRTIMNIEEIMRIEVRNEMFRVLGVVALYDYFNPLEGWSKSYIQQQKNVIKRCDAEVKS